ncbi:efflux RND transporter periplasmic adaptor subunit [Myxococcus landrumensis]|uniref:Efflux RND transporter periplasmic adaptor subunit n=1 Tax=Myxococcus landrumensis TaxID=2813577 RepID=A0ABX7MYN7_9BACT|nr:efflux RND transporter periplasmic adaptor subunit [Myxococcus landrumus]QSQ11323.1 efflux RND transporter periplasmic adaptor subunit [Myxococcus landrumus]
MNSNRKPSAARSLAVAGVVATAVLSLSACGKADASSKTPPSAESKPVAELPSVKLVPARGVRAAPREEVTGTLFPAQALQVGFEVGGRLAAVKVGKGAAVKKGDVLGQLDVEISDAQVAQAEAAVAAADAAATMASDVATRNATLQKEGGVSDLQNRASAAQAAQAQAQLLAAKAQLAQARAARRRHDLKAPFAGTLIDAPEQTGATVGPGTPLFTLEHLDTLVLKTTVAESLRARLKPGTKVRVEAIGDAGVFTQDAVVRTVLPSADPATRRVPVELAVPNADGRFVAHTLARAVLPLGEDQDAQVVPGTALASSNGDHVWVVSTGGEAKRVEVRVLERREREVVVLASPALESVIDYPTPSLAQGSRVTVK